jgi:integrase
MKLKQPKAAQALPSSKPVLTVPQGFNEHEDLLKSVRVYKKGGKVCLDYRLVDEYRKDGKERIRFSLKLDDTPLNMQRTEREKYSLALEHFLSNNEVNDGNYTIEDIALKALNEDKHNRAEDTHNDYIQIYTKYIKPYFGNKHLADIKVTHLKDWKNNLIESHKLSKSRFTKYYRTFNFIWNYALVNEMIDKNPLALVDKKSKQFSKSKSDASQKYYSKDEVQKILEHATGWFKAFLTLSFNTGLRTGEALALQWSDIDFEEEKVIIQRSQRHGKLKETKTNIINKIYMPSPVKEALQLHKQTAKSDLWVFPNEKTLQPYFESRPIVKTYLKPLLERLNIPYKTLYATRHSFASSVVEKNLPITLAQKYLGHQKLSTTMDFYVKNGWMDVANIDKEIDRLFA